MSLSQVIRFRLFFADPKKINLPRSVRNLRVNYPKTIVILYITDGNNMYRADLLEILVVTYL
jgi:hypothetical protein